MQHHTEPLVPPVGKVNLGVGWWEPGVSPSLCGLLCGSLHSDLVLQGLQGNLQDPATGNLTVTACNNQHVDLNNPCAGCSSSTSSFAHLQSQNSGHTLTTELGGVQIHLIFHHWRLVWSCPGKVLSHSTTCCRECFSVHLARNAGDN